MHMKIRMAEEKDIPALQKLLMEVLNIHAKGRPDIFIPDTTKYTYDELLSMIKDPSTPVFTAVDENDEVMGYAMTIIKKRVHDNNMHDVMTLFIDDLCVDQACRGKHAGHALYDAVCDWAKDRGFYNVTLNVWSFNEPAIRFYRSLGMKPMEYVMEQILEEK